jgi:hypothetical protein
MSWLEWVIIWLISTALGGIVVGLALALGLWSLLIIMPLLFFGIGCMVTK